MIRRNLRNRRFESIFRRNEEFKSGIFKPSELDKLFKCLLDRFGKDTSFIEVVKSLKQEGFKTLREVFDEYCKSESIKRRNESDNQLTKMKKGDITLQDIKDHMINNELDEFEISLNTTKYYFELNDDELIIYPVTEFTDSYDFFENSSLKHNSDLDGMNTTLREFNSVLEEYDYETKQSFRNGYDYDDEEYDDEDSEDYDD